MGQQKKLKNILFVQLRNHKNKLFSDERIRDIGISEQTMLFSDTRPHFTSVINALF